jgi:hypothetical protein
MPGEFVAYVGNQDFHDGRIVFVEQLDAAVRVRVRGDSGKEYVVEFSGVASVRAKSPEGMMLYSLSELRAEPPLRRFSFANWDEASESLLEIDAKDFSVTEA